MFFSHLRKKRRLSPVAVGFDTTVVSFYFFYVFSDFYLFYRLQKNIEVKIQTVGASGLPGAIETGEFAVISDQVVDAAGKFNHIVHPSSLF